MVEGYSCNNIDNYSCLSADLYIPRTVEALLGVVALYPRRADRSKDIMERTVLGVPLTLS